MNTHPAHATFDPAPILADFPGRSSTELAEILNVTPCTIRGWRTGRRRLKVEKADELAIRIGTHPALLWPDWLLT